MTRFIAAIVMIALIIAGVYANRCFITDLYQELDARISLIESGAPSANRDAENELFDYWQSKTHSASFTVKESELRSLTALLSKLKVCDGDEYKAALSGARLMIDELGRNESMGFFDLF